MAEVAHTETAGYVIAGTRNGTELVIWETRYTIQDAEDALGYIRRNFDPAAEIFWLISADKLRPTS